MPRQIQESVSVLDGDDLIDTAYTQLTALMDFIKPDSRDQIGVSWLGGKTVTSRHNKCIRLRGIQRVSFMAVANGIYFPATKRCYWLGNFDVGVDEFPKEGCVYCTPHTDWGESFSYVHVKLLFGFDKHIITQCKNIAARYRVSTIGYYPNGAVGESPDIRIETRVSYFAVDQDGYVWSCHDRNKLSDWFGAAWAVQDDRYHAFHLGPGAISLLADRAYLWMIETQERYSDLDAYAKVQFGTDPEMVKSLFYSRTVPITHTGRLRPILHWVNAHKRRMKEGIDIDITKHLRGIERFEMGGLKFTITSPQKSCKS